MEADAFATALMVMPLEKSRALIERESNLEAYWIVETEDGTVEELYSSSFFQE
jgi:thiamine biosynthesis lipoprotein